MTTICFNPTNSWYFDETLKIRTMTWKKFCFNPTNSWYFDETLPLYLIDLIRLISRFLRTFLSEHTMYSIVKEQFA